MSNPNEPKIAPFTPRGLEEPKDQNKMKIQSFTPSHFKSSQVKDYDAVKQTFGNLASTDLNHNSRFSLHPDSKKHLGVEDEERNHLESIIAKEVELRVQSIRDQAFAEGFKTGHETGNQTAQQAIEAKFQPLWDQFSQLVAEFERIKPEMYAANEKVLVQMIFSTARQLILKDLKADPEYVRRLCIQLIEKMGIRDHLKIKVSKTDQENIESLKEYLKGQYSELKNIQIDASDEVQLGGCKIETNLIRMNASVESQLQAIEASFQGSENS